MERTKEIDKATGKPVVLFNKNKLVYLDPDKRFANFFPLNHPDVENVSNCRLVFTSEVKNYEEKDGRIVMIETQNTIYKESE